MSDWDVYGRVGGTGDISTDSRKRKRSGKSDRNGGTGKKHLLKKVQINKQEKKIQTTWARASLDGGFEMDSPWENTPRRRTSPLRYIQKHSEHFSSRTITDLPTLERCANDVYEDI